MWMIDNPVDGRCEAKVGQPPHYLHWHQCRNKSKFTISYQNEMRDVCDIHKRLADRDTEVTHRS
jgi:hypothetical protein